MKFFRKLLQLHDNNGGADHYHRVYFLCHPCNMRQWQFVKCGIKPYNSKCNNCGRAYMWVLAVRNWEAETVDQYILEIGKVTFL